MLPRGVEEYLERRAESLSTEATRTPVEAAGNPVEAARNSVETAGIPVETAGIPASPAQQRDARKAIARIDRQLAKLSDREAALHARLVEHAADYERLAELDTELRELVAQREALEEEWLEAAAVLE
jgi:ATP-binding cassette subfamily F protein uup